MASHRAPRSRVPLGRRAAPVTVLSVSCDSGSNSSSGIGHVTVGMARQGFDLQLTRYDEKGWRATFYTTGMEHSPTSATGSAWEPTPWRAVQGAARDALRKGERRT
jgi:hypothetical protein